MYLLQLSVSRACAPRNGSVLCIVWVQFSAMQSAPRSGNMKFISAGASVPGVFWNTTRTPSSTSSVPVSAISSVGATRSGCARNPFAEAAIDMALRTGRQQHAELIEGPAAHGGASDQVFGDGLPHEPLGRQDTHIPLSTSSVLVTPRMPP